MISQKMQDSENSFLQVLVPRGLVGCGEKISKSIVTPEGLCPLKIHLKDGLVTNIESLEQTKGTCLKILLPRFVESHAHIDKAFTWNSWPNLSGTYQCALEANLKEHETRTAQKVRSRAERSFGERASKDR